MCTQEVNYMGVMKGKGVVHLATKCGGFIELSTYCSAAYMHTWIIRRSLLHTETQMCMLRRDVVVISLCYRIPLQCKFPWLQQPTCRNFGVLVVVFLFCYSFDKRYNLPFPQSSDHEHTIGGLHSEVGRRDSELSKLRDRVNNLTVAVSNLKKELGVKGQEVVMIRRETNNQIR